MTDKKEKREYLKFEGKMWWAKVLPGQAQAPIESTPETKNNLTYSIGIECSKKRFDKLIEAGLYKKNELKEDAETGETYINLKAAKVMTGRDGMPDKVLPDLKVIDKYREPVTEQIGNGSTGICIAEFVVCKHKILKGAKVLRLKCVQVLDHIVYEGGGNMADYEDLLAEEVKPTEVTAEEIEDEEGDDDESYL